MSLVLRSISKRYGREHALADLSLRLEPGDLYGFVGHNGSGKTTALRIALGLVRPDAGSVIVDGHDAALEPREARARCGGLVEIAGFHGGWSARANLELLARLAGASTSEARTRCTEVLERVGLAAAADRAVGGYSQGMRQRLGIAAALLGRPRYLLLDEPMNALDPEGIADLRALLVALAHDEKVGVLVSSHQLAELATFATKIGVVRAGRLVLEAPTSDLLGAAARRYEVTARDFAGLDAALSKQGLAIEQRVDGARRIDLGAQSPSHVLRALVTAGVDVESFAPRARSLEEIYLAASHGELPAGVGALATSSASAPEAPAARIAPGHAVTRAVRGELTRFARSQGVWAAAALPAVVGVLAMLARGARGAGDEANVSGAQLFSATRVGAFEAVGVGLRAGLPVLVLVLLGLASQSIAAEHARGTLRNTLLRPFARLDVLLGKAFAAVFAALAGYAVLAAAVLAFAALRFDFGDVVDVLPDGSTFPLAAASELWPQLWAAVASPLVALCAYALVGLACGAIVRTGSAALALALGVGIALDLARGLFGRALPPGLLPSEHLPSPLSDDSRMRFYVDVAQGISNASFDLDGARALWPLAWCALTVLVAARSLVRKDVP